MDDIRLPMVTGSMDDISQEGSAGAESQESEERDSMSTQGQRAIYAREANIQVDYENLEDELKEVGHMIQAMFLFCYPDSPSWLARAVEMG